MAYLHCHSCGWSQDDFYTKAYNLWTKIKDDLKWYCRPRLISFDDYFLVERTKNTEVPVLTFKTKRGTVCFSWNFLILEIINDLKVYHQMKWKTLEQWEREKDKAVCPKCGARNFDID